MTPHPKREYAPEEIILQVLTALDIASGDSDPNIDPDMTDDEVRDEYPIVWAMQQLTSLHSQLAAQKSDNAQLQYALEQSEAKWIAAQKGEDLPYPDPESVWIYKGDPKRRYVVITMANVASRHPSHEPSVVYRTESAPECVWILPVTNFYSVMTRMQT